MKKILYTLALTILAYSARSQTSLKEYVAGNKVTYKIGDTIKLGRGSDPQGNFRYLEIGGWAAGLSYDVSKGPEQLNLGRSYSGLAVVLKKIRQVKSKGVTKTIFVVGGGNITNYNLSIEDAIASCEIENCTGNKKDLVATETNLDKLKKLKELMDSGAITQSEYDLQKKKILDQL